MKSSWISMVVLVALLAGLGVWLAHARDKTPGSCCLLGPPADSSCPSADGDSTARREETVRADRPADQTGLPRLIDLGAKSCIPCKLMAPILEELRRDYADQFVTEFIDVRENPQAGRDYDIRRIPTQIFLDANGRELYRHEDFLSKEAILAKWKELGVEVR